MPNLDNRSDYRKEICTRVCEKIKELREHSGMTQAELAKKANIAQSTLSYVEAGSKSPTIDTMAALAEALGVPLRMLMPEEETPGTFTVKSPTAQNLPTLTDDDYLRLKEMFAFAYDKFVAPQPKRSHKKKKNR